MRLIHPVTGLWREVPEPKLPARLSATGKSGTGLPHSKASGGLRASSSTMNEAMQRMIRPEAQPRWLLPSLALITPQYIEAILQGALAGNHVLEWQLFDLMESSWPRLVKNLNELKEAAIGKVVNEWRIEPWSKKGEKPSVTAMEKAALVEEALFGMKGVPQNDENGLESTLYDVLDAWAKGVSLLEIEWEQRESAQLGEMFAPKSTYWVHPRNYAWGSDGRLGLVLPESYDPRNTNSRPTYAGFVDTATRMQSPYEAQNGFTEIPEDKFLVCIRKARTGHPLGGALLRALAWWWCAGNFSAEWLLNFAQIFGIPMRWANYAPSAPQETVDKICEILANMGSQAWAAFPAGTTMELKEASGSGENMPQANMMDRCDKQCDLLILGQSMTTQVAREGGARAQAEVGERKEEKNEDAAARFAAAILNRQLIPAICRLNYGDDSETPAWVPDEEEPEAAKANAEVLTMAVNMGVPVPVAFALQKLNIPAAEGDEELLQPLQPAASDPNAGGGSSQDNGLSARARRHGHSCGWSSTQPRSAVLTATDKLTDSVMEELAGIEARWLGNVKPFFRRLVWLAANEKVSDADFTQALQSARRQIPELFSKLDTAAVRDALERAMGAAVVNGAARGAMERRVGRARTQRAQREVTA